MPDIVVTISVTEKKLFEAFSIDEVEWISNLSMSKARKLADRVIYKLTDLNPQKMTQKEKVNKLTELYNAGLLEPGSMRDVALV